MDDDYQHQTTANAFGSPLDQQSLQLQFSGPQPYDNTSCAPNPRRSTRHMSQPGLYSYQTSLPNEWMNQNFMELDFSTNSITTPTLSSTGSFEEPLWPVTPSSIEFEPGFSISHEPTSPSISSESSWRMFPDCAQVHQSLQINGTILSPSITSLGPHSHFGDNWMLDQAEMLIQATDDTSSAASDHEDEGDDDSGDNPRNHEWYTYGKTGDRYTCPRVDCDWEGCKLKCDYHKHIDKHLLPYECKRPGCEKNGEVQRFSSRACLLRHEREKHRLHNAAAYYCRYIGPGKCERTEGYGRPFPRAYNAEDHMKRCHDPSELAPPSTQKKQRRRRASNVFRASSKSGRSSSSTTPTLSTEPTKGKAAVAPPLTSTFDNDLGLTGEFQDPTQFMNLNTLQAYTQPQLTRAASHSKVPMASMGARAAGIAKSHRPSSADRIRKMEEMMQHLSSLTSHIPAARKQLAALQQLHSENVQDMIMPADTHKAPYLSPQPIGLQQQAFFPGIDDDYFFPSDEYGG